MTLAILATAPLACSARSTITTRVLARGVTLTQEITEDAAPLRVHILRVDLKTPGVKVRSGQAWDSIRVDGPARGRESLHLLAGINSAFAAVNADFFEFNGSPVGLAIRDGELYHTPLPYRVCLGLRGAETLMDVLTAQGSLTTQDSTVLSLQGLNRLPRQDEAVVISPLYRSTPQLAQGGVVVVLNKADLPVRAGKDCRASVDTVEPLNPSDPLPACSPDHLLLVATGKSAQELARRCRPGDSVTVRFDLIPTRPVPPKEGAGTSSTGLSPATSPEGSVWADVEQAVEGGPWLVHKGEIALDDAVENFASEAFVRARHARTAVGVQADGSLLLVTVDGKQKGSRGMSLDELARLMRRSGAVEAINLDGGGSSTMVVEGGVVNAPSDGRERPIADCLLVYGDATEESIAGDWQVQPASPGDPTLHPGDTLALKLVDAAGAAVPKTAVVVWGTENGAGFVSQQGQFTAGQPGACVIVAHCGGHAFRLSIKVLPLQKDTGSAPQKQ